MSSTANANANMDETTRCYLCQEDDLQLVQTCAHKATVCVSCSEKHGVCFWPGCTGASAGPGPSSGHVFKFKRACSSSPGVGVGVVRGRGRPRRQQGRGVRVSRRTWSSEGRMVEALDVDVEVSEAGEGEDLARAIRASLATPPPPPPLRSGAPDDADADADLRRALEESRREYREHVRRRLAVEEEEVKELVGAGAYAFTSPPSRKRARAHAQAAVALPPCRFCGKSYKYAGRLQAHEESSCLRRPYVVDFREWTSSSSSSASSSSSSSSSSLASVLE